MGALLAAAALTAQSASADIFERARRLGRGVNFGNALEAPKEGEWGLTLKEEWFRLVAEAGFRHVRVPIKWSAHAAAQAPYAVEPAFFARIDWVLDQAAKQGLAAVINVHHYDEMATAPAAHKDRWLGIWKQIAERYKDRGPDVYFEIMNEPNGALTAALWNQYVQEALAVIRPLHPTRPVAVGPVDWNNVARLKDLALPAGDRNLLVTFHYYSPFQFTHQGAEWATGSDAWLGTTWDADDEPAVERDIQVAKAYGAAQQRPVWMGEFGAYRKADQASRLRWTRFVARTAEKHGMTWAYWEFGSGFGVFDPAANAWRQDLKEALVGTPLSAVPVERPSRGSAGRTLRVLLDGSGHPAGGVLARAADGSWQDARGRRSRPR